MPARVAEPHASPQRLLVIITRNQASLDDLITGLLDIGITGATVVESRGLAAIVREDMPMFAGLAELLPQSTGSRVILSLAPQPFVDMLQSFVNEMKIDDRPLVIVMPVEQVIGLVK
jgi:hypothetical protein